MDNDEFWYLTVFGLIAILALSAAAGGIGYKLGRRQERKEMSSAFVTNIESAYDSGFDDGFHYGERKHG